jgi:DNA-binding beta-propeller fold protein YncE
MRMNGRNMAFVVTFALLISGLYAATEVFQPVLSVPAGISPRGVAVGSPFGNGVQDFVVANFGSPTFIGQSTSSDQMNLGNSTVQVFAPSPSGLRLVSTIATAASPRGVCLFDLGNEGRQDILVTAYDAGLLQVFSWRNGEFVKTSEKATLKMPVGVAAGYTHSGGEAFVVVANYGSNKISFFQVQEGRLGERFDVPVEEGPTQVAIGDLNGDGVNEVVVACLPAHKMIVLSQKSAGKDEGLASFSLSDSISLPNGSAPADLTIADLDGDGRKDILAADFSLNTINLYFQQTNGALLVQPILSTSGNHPNGLTVADLDRDGKMEVIVANRDSDLIDIFKMENGHYYLKQTIKLSEDSNSSFGPVEIGVLDAQGDGHLDLAISHMRSNSIKVLSRIGSGDPTPASYFNQATEMAFSEKTTYCSPNPSRDGTAKIYFSLDSISSVDIQIFDVKGELVWSRTLSPAETQRGTNRVSWDGVNQRGGKLASGLYLYRVTVGDKQVMKKAVLIR